MINIRKMRVEDRQSVYEILQHTEMFTPAEISVAMELIDIYLFNHEQKDYLIFVAELENRNVAGYVCFGPTPATEGTFDLYWIAVDPRMQGKGIGKTLLNFVENKIKLMAGRLIIIETSSQQKYALTQKFYLDAGYRIEAKIKDFYRPDDDRLIFTKRLNSKPVEG
ncbi:MAG: hypothetical protein Kow0037_23950 [Calditrichia bacterium]